MGGIFDFSDIRGIFVLHSPVKENKNNEGNREKINSAIQF